MADAQRVPKRRIALRRRAIAKLAISLARGAIVLFIALLAGCANAPVILDPDSTDQLIPDNDLLEPVNRVLYRANVGLEYALVGPLAYGYRHLVPRALRNAIRDVLANASGPVVAANHVLQGKFCRAGDTALRFLINTTAGLAGAIDVADQIGVPAQPTDFGVTLGRWGVPTGSYLYIPILTSSDVRDLGGLSVDIAIDPWSWGFSGVPLDTADWGRLSGQIIDLTEQWIDDVRNVKDQDFDPYVGYRSMYLQYRQHRVEIALRPDRGVACGDGSDSE